MNSLIDDTWFDREIDRHGTDSLKWDLEPELDPLWVADMDFPAPDCVLEALAARVKHGVFGYTMPPADMNDVLADYMKRCHHVEIDRKWIVHMGGCVPALSTSVMAVCSPENSVMCCTPVYPPIRNAHVHGKCASIEVPHVFRSGRWEFDWDAMELAVQSDTRLFILCNPQNPLGRVWTRDEVLKVADFCERHDLILCSDEIHCDLKLDEHAVHVSAMSLPERYLNRTIMMTAPSKTYNIAGIGYTMVLIPSPELREAFRARADHLQPAMHCFSYLAARAAYADGEPWKVALLKYLRGNLSVLQQFVRQRMPKIKLAPLQATYLAWLDCSELGLVCPQQFLKEQAKLFLNDGAAFGNPQCVRLNLGTQRAHLIEALEKMANAFDSL